MRSDWKTVNVKKTLLEKIEGMLHRGKLKNEGVTNTSQFIDIALKEKIEKLEEKNMSQVNLHGDHVRIMDNRLGKVGRIVSVYYRRGDSSWCDYCEESDCIHVQFAWELPDVKMILEGFGMKPPPSRVD